MRKKAQNLCKMNLIVIRSLYQHEFLNVLQVNSAGKDAMS